MVNESDWHDLLREWSRIKAAHGLNNAAIAAMFGTKYKDGRSFEKSTAYRHMVAGLVAFYKTIQNPGAASLVKKQSKK